jgi:hypothetical protein
LKRLDLLKKQILSRHARDQLRDARSLAARSAMDPADLTEVWDAVRGLRDDVGRVPEMVDDTDALMRLLSDTSVSFLVYKRPVAHPRDLRHATLLAGFVAKRRVTVILTVADYVVLTRDLEEGDFVYAVEDRHVLPVTTLRFHEVKVHPREHVDAVCVELQSSERRRHICRSSWHSHPFGPDRKYAQFASGMMRLLDAEGQLQPGSLELPGWDRRDLVQEARDRTAVLLQEFAQRTWHPSRLQRWCLAHDDEFADAKADGSKHRMWLGDVMLLDDFVVPDELLVGFIEERRMCMAHEDASDHFLRAIQRELCHHGLPGLRVVGEKLVCGCYHEGEEGMHAHRDESLQGGDMTLVVYLNDVPEGGHLVFCDPGLRIRPKKHRCVIFGVDKVHRVDPVTRGRKHVVACECAFGVT